MIPRCSAAPIRPVQLESMSPQSVDCPPVISPSSGRSRPREQQRKEVLPLPGAGDSQRFTPGGIVPRGSVVEYSHCPPDSGG